MPVGRFALFTSLGAGLWSAVLVGIGYLAGETEEAWRPLVRQATGWLLVAIVRLVGGYLWIHHRAGRRL